MSNLSEILLSINPPASIGAARVLGAEDGGVVTVRVGGTDRMAECHVLATGGEPVALCAGDDVLVWLADASASGGVVIGKIVAYAQPNAISAAAELAARPPKLLFEAQGDIVLRNGGARLTLGRDGDVDLVCKRFTARGHRLLELLAPMIKLN
ncbi:hypothetical protein [Caballeronia sp. GAFFF1]|uniref:hypothetical protein n=1 Tax=Caballeronia sp. GAFFF1 TaxID=2921779 RepID=UPI002028806D|nr:hypothetical protein [Caballeronia sp. GAFFF1]